MTGLDGAQSPNQRVTGQTILRHFRLCTRVICGVGLMSPPSLPWLEKLNPVKCSSDLEKMIRSSLWCGWLCSDCGVRSVLCGWWLVGVGLGMNGLVLKMNNIYIYIQICYCKWKAKRNKFYGLLLLFYTIDESFPQNIEFTDQIECQEFKQAHRSFNCENN